MANTWCIYIHAAFLNGSSIFKYLWYKFKEHSYVYGTYVVNGTCGAYGAYGTYGR